MIQKKNEEEMKKDGIENIIYKCIEFRTANAQHQLCTTSHWSDLIPPRWIWPPFIVSSLKRL